MKANNTATISGPRIVDKLKVHDVIITKAEDIEAYLVDHRELEPLLDAICNKARVEFGNSTELSLQVYRDPEIEERYLTLYVRQETYDPVIIDRIETMCEAFHRELETTNGYLLVTTDFRKPGSVHAV